MENKFKSNIEFVPRQEAYFTMSEDLIGAFQEFLHSEGIEFQEPKEEFSTETKRYFLVELEDSELSPADGNDIISRFKSSLK